MVNMKYIFGAFLLGYSGAALSDTPFSYGIGFGSLYSGMGANVGYARETHLEYLSTGCMLLRMNGSTVNSDETACGFGLGAVNSKMFNNFDNRISLGLYYGIISFERDNTGSVDPIYGFALSFVLWKDDDIKKGLNASATPILVGDGADLFGNYFGIGYQF